MNASSSLAQESAVPAGRSPLLVLLFALMADQMGFTTTADGARIAYFCQPGNGTPFLGVNDPGEPSQRIYGEVPASRAYSEAFGRGQPYWHFDWRGAGMSSPIEGSYTFEQMVADVGAVAGVIGRPFHLEGWAWGNFAAVRL